MIFNADQIRKVCPDLEVNMFDSLSQWEAWRTKNPGITDYQNVRHRVRTAALAHGIESLWFGHIEQARVVCGAAGVQGPPWIFERHRMLLDIVAAMPGLANWKACRIYAAEGSSPWALQMRGRFPRFLGSEYMPGPDGAKRLFPIPHQDLTKLTLPDAAFDLAVTQEVLEHVSDLAAAVNELARILRPGGTLLSTFPFLWNSEKTEIKAHLAGDRVEHVGAPEYHVDPLSEAGALVFQLPAWDILDLCRQAGFRQAQFLLYSTTAGAVVGQHLGGLWCLVCQR